MDSKILSYKIPYDIPSQNVKKDDIFVIDGKHVKHGNGLKIPKEIAESWEPIYEWTVEFKDPEMFINLKSTGMTVMPFVASHVIHNNEKEAREEAKEIMNHAGTFKLIKI